MGKTVTVRTSFRSGRFYPAGSEVDADDPIVKRFPSMFETPAVRTTATVPGEVTSPPPATSNEPAGNASTETWRAYCVSLGADPADVAELGRGALKDLADELS